MKIAHRQNIQIPRVLLDKFNQIPSQVLTYPYDDSPSYKTHLAQAGFGGHEIIYGLIHPRDAKTIAQILTLRGIRHIHDPAAGTGGVAAILKMHWKKILTASDIKPETLNYYPCTQADALDIKTYPARDGLAVVISWPDFEGEGVFGLKLIQLMVSLGVTHLIVNDEGDYNAAMTKEATTYLTTHYAVIWRSQLFRIREINMDDYVYASHIHNQNVSIDELFNVVKKNTHFTSAGQQTTLYTLREQ